jgi:sec-independent protein translocase protein TatB
MFNVGGMELLVIAVLALVVLGPDKLPGAIRQLGQFTGELRRISRGFQTDPGDARAAAEIELAALEGPAEPSVDDDRTDHAP